MLISLILLVLLATGYILTRVGTHIIFRPKRKRWPLHLPFKPVHTEGLTGIYLPAKQGRDTLLFFHGRGGNVSHFENFAQTYAPHGYGILMFDYRGFGLSKGAPSQAHMQQDALAAVQYAKHTLGIPPEHLIIYGHSLGNSAALFAARHTPCKALILQSPFLSTPDMAASWALHAYAPHRWSYRVIRALVTPFLWCNRFENTHLTTGIELPVLLCMSKADKTLPWQQSAKLADTIPHVQRFLSLAGEHDEFVWAANAVLAFFCTQGK